MKKITELIETRWRTIHTVDEYGNRERDAEEFTCQREVKTIDPGPRFGHFLVDMLLFQILMYLVDFLFDLLSNLTNFSVGMNLTIDLLVSIISLLLFPAYYAFFEYNWQKSPGKFLTKSVVIDEYGNKPELKAIILRSVIRLVPFEPFSCYDSSYSYGWHDKWSKTWVVSEEELKTLKKLQAEQSEDELL